VHARVGLLIETSGLYTHLTPRELPRFHGRLHRLHGQRLEDTQHKTLLLDRRC
jgi:ABC-type Na+ transport system ATPase subunit NatA